MIQLPLFWAQAIIKYTWGWKHTLRDCSIQGVCMSRKTFQQICKHHYTPPRTLRVPGCNAMWGGGGMPHWTATSYNYPTGQHYIQGPFWFLHVWIQFNMGPTPQYIRPHNTACSTETVRTNMSMSIQKGSQHFSRTIPKTQEDKTWTHNRALQNLLLLYYREERKTERAYDEECKIKRAKRALLKKKKTEALFCYCWKVALDFSVILAASLRPCHLFFNLEQSENALWRMCSYWTSAQLQEPSKPQDFKKKATLKLESSQAQLC